VRVVIADDQAVVRSGLRRILETAEELEVVGEAIDGVSAVDAAVRLKPDLVPGSPAEGGAIGTLDERRGVTSVTYR